jgi:hypothetical protein
MPDQINLDLLIAYLRQELDEIDRAILVLKRTAMARRAGARCRARRSFRVHVNEASTKDRVRKG